MSLFFIHVKEIESGDEYIYNKVPVNDIDIEALFKQFYNNLIRKDALECNLQETFCEISEETEQIILGYFWNSIASTKQVKYLLRSIPCTEQSVTKEHKDTQTINTTCKKPSYYDHDLNRIYEQWFAGDHQSGYTTNLNKVNW